MNKIFCTIFTKWWIYPLFAAIFVGLAFMLENDAWLLIGGLFIGITSLISIYLDISSKPIPIHVKNYRKYTKHYENRSKIQRAIGLKIPKFKIWGRSADLNEFDFTFKVVCTIKFDKMPDDKLFSLLDSICQLPVPEKTDKNASYFGVHFQHNFPYWSKHGDIYKYNRTSGFREKFLHSEYAYFHFEISKGSKTAKFEYGGDF